MADPALVERCVRGLAAGLAVVDAAAWTILFENARFFQWFPPGPDGEDDLAARLPGLEIEAVRKRFDEGRPVKHAADVKVGARTVSVALELRAERHDGREVVVVEAHDVSKQKEAEYMLDSYSQLAERNARELQKEKDRVEKLLLNIMPRAVYQEMKDYGTATPQRFDSVSVLMLDFVGFTEMAIARDPSAIVAELNDIFSAFDRIAELFGCERIKTIGDAYVAVSGLPEPNVDHAHNIAKVALRMRRYLERRNASHPTRWRCRIGVATGPLIGSLVGIQKYVYDIFGPAVNLAARLEAICKPMQITVSAETATALGTDFVLDERPPVDLKGFEGVVAYTLDDERQPLR